MSVITIAGAVKTYPNHLFVQPVLGHARSNVGMMVLDFDGF